jgi:hypothetical protein
VALDVRKIFVAGDSQPNPASLESYPHKTGHYNPTKMEGHPQLKGEELTILLDKYCYELRVDKISAAEILSVIRLTLQR